MATNALLFIVCIVVPVLDAVWELGSGTLPRADWDIAVGAYNDSIFIIGGESESHQATEYQISTNTFIDLGSNRITDAISGEGQFWVHKGEILYMLHEPKAPTSPSLLGVFNMTSKHYISHWMNVTFPYKITYGCLAISDQYLFEVGGFTGNTYLDTTHVLSLTTHEWMNNTPTMISRRAYNCCFHHRDLLCTFGGYDKKATAESECINTSDIFQNAWSSIPPLTEAVYRHRVTAASNYFYILGGYTQGNEHYKDTMHIYDMDANTMVLSDDHMVYGMTQHALITVHNVIYVFGGGSTAFLDTRMKYDLLSTAPSSTNAPSGNPSKMPSETVAPSSTNHPSLKPSRNPSIHPTIPSSHPSMVPNQSTSISTDHPSLKPSVNPTEDATGSPTHDPVENPTEDETTTKPSVSHSDPPTRVTETLSTFDMDHVINKTE
eukprot:757018_1